jgi:hypothetical protein
MQLSLRRKKKNKKITELVKVLDATENKSAYPITRAIRDRFPGHRFETRELVSDKILELSGIQIENANKGDKMDKLKTLLDQSPKNPAAEAAAKALLTKLPHLTEADYEGFSYEQMAALHRMGKVDISKLGATSLNQEDVLAILLETSISTAYPNSKAAKEVINASTKILIKGNREAVQPQLVKRIKDAQLMGLLLKQIPKNDQFTVINNAGISPQEKVHIFAKHPVFLSPLNSPHAIELLNAAATEDSKLSKKEATDFIAKLLKAVEKNERLAVLFDDGVQISNKLKAELISDLKLGISAVQDPTAAAHLLRVTDKVNPSHVQGLPLNIVEKIIAYATSLQDENTRASLLKKVKTAVEKLPNSQKRTALLKKIHAEDEIA